MDKNHATGGALAALIMIAGIAAVTPTQAAPSGSCSLQAVDWALPLGEIAQQVDYNQLTCTGDQWRDAALGLVQHHLTIPGSSTYADPLGGDIAVSAKAQLTVRQFSGVKQGQSVEAGEAHILSEDGRGTAQSLLIIAGQEGEGFLIASAGDEQNADGVMQGVGHYQVRDEQAFSMGGARSAPMTFYATDNKPGVNGGSGQTDMACACGLTLAKFGKDSWINALYITWASPIEFSYSPGTRTTPILGLPGVGVTAYPVTVKVQRFNIGAVILPCAQVSGYVSLNGCLFGVDSTFTTVTGYIYDPYLTPATTVLWLCTGGHLTLLVFGFGINNLGLPPMPCR